MILSSFSFLLAIDPTAPFPRSTSTCFPIFPLHETRIRGANSCFCKPSSRSLTLVFTDALVFFWPFKKSSSGCALDIDLLLLATHRHISLLPAASPLQLPAAPLTSQLRHHTAITNSTRFLLLFFSHHRTLPAGCWTSAFISIGLHQQQDISFSSLSAEALSDSLPTSLLHRLSSLSKSITS